jgi:hypothetical protein
MPMPSIGFQPQGLNAGTYGGPSDYSFPGYPPGIHAASGLAELFSGDLDGLDGSFGFVDLVQYDPSALGTLG